MLQRLAFSLATSAALFALVGCDTDRLVKGVGKDAGADGGSAAADASPMADDAALQDAASPDAQPADAAAPPALRIITPYLPPANVGDSVSRPIQAEGGQPPYHWTLEGTAPGLTFNSTSATIVGTASVSGYYDFRAIVTDSATPPGRDTFRYQLLFSDPPVMGAPPDIQSPSHLPTAYQGESYYYMFALRGLDRYQPMVQIQFIWFILEGAVPGLQMNFGNDIFGTPTMPGTYPLIIMTQNPYIGTAFQKNMTVEVRPPRQPYTIGRALAEGTEHGFVVGPSLKTPMFFGQSLVTLKDGRVMLLGGTIAEGTRATQIFDVDNGFTKGSSLAFARTGQTATVLDDGRVIIVGGNRPGDIGAEIFDPTTGAFTPSRATFGALRLHSAAKLPSGEVFVAGGEPAYDTPFGIATGVATQATFLYHGDTDTFDPGPLLAVARIQHQATVLSDGRVVITGGFANSAIAIDRVEILETGVMPRMRDGGRLVSPRYSHDAVLLETGKILVTGGWNGDNMLASAEIYDPDTGTSRAIENMHTQRRQHVSVTLADGRVLIYGGQVCNTAAQYAPPCNMEAPRYEGAEIFDPLTETFTPIHAVFNRWGASLFVLPSGAVVAVGGMTNSFGGGVDERMLMSEIYVP
jgi:hypothetical protein